MGGGHPDSVETVTPARRATSHAGPARVRRRMPVVSVAGVAVAALALLPLGYLLVRSSELGWERVFEIAFSDRTQGLLWRTGLLAVSVTASAVAIAVPVAWLTVRTDVPLRRFWVIATALPLAIPTYVGSFAFIGAVGPRGILQRSEEHTSELQSLMRISYAVFCLKQKTRKQN